MRGFELDILVVTADIESPWYADARLSGRGFAVRLTGDAGVAVQSAAADPPDVVVVDLTSPGLDTPALVRALRGQLRGGKPPLVLVAVGVACGDDPGAAPVPEGVDLLLGRDGPGAGGAVVGALNRLQRFLTDLRPCGDGPCGSASAGESVAARLALRSA